VFSLGCVLFECLTGEPAFSGVHLMAVFARILFDAPPRLSDKHPDLPPALDALLDRMLAKSPEGRPRDGAAVAAALRALGEIPEGAASLPSAKRDRSRALTDSEQRAVAVILISPSRAPDDDAVARRDEALRAEAARHGGHFEQLLNGSAAVVLSSATVATDLASQAARCALAIRALAPGCAVALALGRSETTGRLTMGPTIDRAARL